MTQRKTVTISIAAYNMEKYLCRTLDSLMDERVIDDLEVLVIDDGSTDQTLEIAKKYARRYPQSIFPIHKENGGYGSTINLSISRATGKYFRQLDGDDWLNEDTLYEWVQLLKQIDVDLFLSLYIRTDPNEGWRIIRDLTGTLTEGIHGVEEIAGIKTLSMHQSTYKTSVLKQVTRKLPEHCLYTDTEFVSYPLPFVQTFYVWRKPLYMLRAGREGQSISDESIRRHYMDQHKVLMDLIDYMQHTKFANDGQRHMIQEVVRGQVGTQFAFRSRLQPKKTARQSVHSFYLEMKKEHPDVLRMTQEKSKWLKLYAWSDGALFPLLQLAKEIKNKVRLNG